MVSNYKIDINYNIYRNYRSIYVKMDEFLKLYKVFMEDTTKEDIGRRLLNDGLKIVDNYNANNMIKEQVLTHLIYVYPKKAELYYKMGVLFRGFSIEKEIMWYKISNSIDPDYFENLFAICKSLFINKKYPMIIELNKNNLFDKYTNETEFIYYYVESMLTMNKMNKCLKYALLINDYFIKKTIVNNEECFLKWNSYICCAKIYFLQGNIENSIKYMEYALDFAKKTTINDYIIQSMQQYIALYDHKYHDNKKLYENNVKLNYYLRDNPIFTFKNNKTHRKIRIGYISSDYALHAVSNFILPILKNHDNDKFETYIYSNQPVIHPMFTALNIPHYKIFEMSDKDAAKLINSQEIDILIDLNGLTTGNRLDVLAYRPAPIQITYIGHPNTTGLKYIQYKFVDEITDSRNSKQSYSEELIRLPKCFLLYESVYQKEPIKPKTTISNNIILGSLNKEPKNSVNTLNAWKKIMQTCTNTKLVIKIESYDNIEERLQYYMEHLNVEKGRLLIIKRLNDEEYVQLFKTIDILLDTFPYSGTTTSCNALYNSIPIVTMYNENYHVHNVTSSILINSGLPELVAKDEDEYIKIACNLIKDCNKIDEYKQNIRGMFLNLMEPKSFMKPYEYELTKLYNKHVLQDDK